LVQIVVERESTVYREALVWARGQSTDAIEAMCQPAIYDLADMDPDWPGPVGRFDAAERLRAYETELARRARLDRLASGTASPQDRRHAAWSELARTVRQVVSVPEVLHLAGVVPRRVGQNSRRGVAEYHSPCPVCRDGVDRLISWDGPNGRAWCRQCGWSADAIAVTQSLIPECSEFRDAVKFLAQLAGMRQEAS
jgi:hypothetical protein